MSTEGTYYVYRHIRPDKNQVFYIGIGSEKYGRAKETRKRSKWWNHIVQKNEGQYRIDIILRGLSRNLAVEKEREFIALYGRRSHGEGTLVNFQDSDDRRLGYKMTESNKKKLSEIMKGNTYGKGFKWSQEKKEHFSKIRTGASTALKGRSWSEEIKRKMSLGHLGNPSHRGKVWINNGTNSTLVYKDEEIPAGWRRGRQGGWFFTRSKTISSNT